MSTATRAVILAAGRGTRMRAGSETDLTADQLRAAEHGLKGLVPIRGRAFLDWSLDRLARAGITNVTIVMAPDTEQLWALLQPRTEPHVDHAIQTMPLGSADAMLAAEGSVGGEPFVVINADNLYPSRDIARLANLAGPGLVAWSRTGLEAGGIAPGRVAAFALLGVSDDDVLRTIVEKPTSTEAAVFGPDALVSMTCWRFGSEIFEACRRIDRSARGEYELPDAVRLLVGQGTRFRVLRSDRPVLDLTSRADIAGVEALLAEEGP